MDVELMMMMMMIGTQTCLGIGRDSISLRTCLLYEQQKPDGVSLIPWNHGDGISPALTGQGAVASDAEI